MRFCGKGGFHVHCHLGGEFEFLPYIMVDECVQLICAEALLPEGDCSNVVACTVEHIDSFEQHRTLLPVRDKPDHKGLEHHSMEVNNHYKGFDAPSPFENGGIRAGVES